MLSEPKRLVKEVKNLQNNPKINYSTLPKKGDKKGQKMMNFKEKP